MNETATKMYGIICPMLVASLTGGPIYEWKLSHCRLRIFLMTSTWLNIPSRCADGDHRSNLIGLSFSVVHEQIMHWPYVQGKKKKKRGVMLVDGFKGAKQRAVQQFWWKNWWIPLVKLGGHATECSLVPENAALCTTSWSSDPNFWLLSFEVQDGHMASFRPFLSVIVLLTRILDQNFTT